MESANIKYTPLTPEDAEALFLYRSNPSVSRYQGWAPSAIEEADNFIAGLEPMDWNKPGWYQIGLRHDGRLIGDMGVHILDMAAEPEVELGITLSPDWQKRGLAREALSTVIAYAFAMGKTRIVASVDPRNLPSVGLFTKTHFVQHSLEKAAYELRGEMVDDLVLELTLDAWQAGGSR